MKRCLKCDDFLYHNLNLFEYLVYDDCLCKKCRSSLVFKPQNFLIEDLKVESFYLYEENFKLLLLSYKEFYDEALYPVFIRDKLLYLKLKYFNYTISYVPSSFDNFKRRGFNHLEMIFKELKLEKIDLFYKDGNYNQNNLNFKDRAKIKNHIFLKENIKIPKKVLLVDDVVTSSATIMACYKILKLKNIKTKALIISYNSFWQKV